ncbi:alpha/beta fold hydrolase [Streptomyces lavendulae]|uniref:alpha/beta fold hydrolase n=1 Tax=Streptomyces lavendulae TaxID=1914 RepID=UPI0024A5A15F|nr:alpha/beta hydrolase [Streptomyces lavendulae]GLX24890.1 alpha/beta hydrolase [Streptomyces lavendulae subsp. lavendulae]
MREVILDNGRTLAVEEWGEAGGTPVVYLHGSPMSRLARHPDDSLFRELGVRLITYDRPGFGCSTPHEGRRVADAAADVAAVADALGLDRFAVFGVSGGGPHALACAAALPARVTRAAALASLAPRDADGLEWTAGMNEGNRRSAAAALSGRAAVVEHLANVGTAGLPPLPEVEQEVLSRPDVSAMLGAAFAEAVRPGLDGWVDDVVALFGTGWGFDPAAVRVPVRLWHGGLDTLVPPSHGEWLAARIPGAALRLEAGAGHGGHFDATPAMLGWLAAGAEDPA